MGETNVLKFMKEMGFPYIKDDVQVRRVLYRLGITPSEDVNQIEIQIKVLEELAKKPMTSAELRQFIESLDGDYYLMLPILKSSRLLEIKRAETGKQGSGFVYSLKKL